MRPVETYAAEGWQLFGVGTTASGLASAAQLTDVTPSAMINIGESAAPTRFILIKAPTAIPTPPAREPYLSAEDSPPD